jgi:hypothetical protein
MVLRDVIAALDVARAAMKIIPVIGGRLEGGLEVLLLLCKHAEVKSHYRNFPFALTISTFRPSYRTKRT